MTSPHPPTNDRDGAYPPVDVAHALLNLLEDFGEEVERLSEARTALLNVLEDDTEEKARLHDISRATLNVLEDMDVERTRAENASRQMAYELLERQRAEESLRVAKAATDAALLNLEQQHQELQETVEKLEQARTQTSWLAQHDALTGLPNRALFLDRLSGAIARSQRMHRGVALLFLDLDHFKDVNDTIGHPAGDELLREMSHRLLSAVRRTDTLARMGGDEFLFVIEDLADPKDIIPIASKLLEEARSPVQIQGQTVLVTASIGVALYPTDGSSPDALLKSADAAMYAAKIQGRDRFAFFSEQMAEDSAKRMTLTRDLRVAVTRSQLRLFFQPVIEISSGRVLGAEALVRWQHPDRGLIAPSEFIDLAEQTGLVTDIDRWTLATAVQQLAAWQSGSLAGLSVSVNASAADFTTEAYAGVLRELLHVYHLSPGSLVIEVTERTAFSNFGHPAELIPSLRALGVGFALDDFGTGYSALTSLARLPLDIVKLDRGFMARLATSARDRSLVAGIIAIGHSIGYQVIAEGVESRDQLDYLTSAGCDGFQGFLASPPLPAPEFEAFAARTPASTAASR